MEHKLIQGGEQYLPFARSRIKALRNIPGLQYASQRYVMPDGEVSVRIEPGQDYIHLTGGQLMFLSGVIRAGTVTEGVPASPGVPATPDRLHEYLPTQEAWDNQKMDREGATATTYHDESRLVVKDAEDQYADVSPSMFSGLMAKAVATVMAQGKPVKYGYKWAKCHGVLIGPDDTPWLVEISQSNGVLLKRFGVVGGSGKYKSSKQDALKETATLFGGIPSGATFPLDADLPAAIAKGDVLQLLAPAGLADAFSKSTYSSALGWSFNNTDEAHNTCYSGTTGFHYKLKFTIGNRPDDRAPGGPIVVASVILFEVENGVLHNGSDGPLDVPFSFFEPQTGALQEIPYRTSIGVHNTPLLAYHVDGVLETVRLKSNAPDLAPATIESSPYCSDTNRGFSDSSVTGPYRDGRSYIASNQMPGREYQQSSSVQWSFVQTDKYMTYDGTTSWGDRGYTYAEVLAESYDPHTIRAVFGTIALVVRWKVIREHTTVLKKRSVGLWVDGMRDGYVHFEDERLDAVTTRIQYSSWSDPDPRLQTFYTSNAEQWVGYSAGFELRGSLYWRFWNITYTPPGATGDGVPPSCGPIAYGGDSSVLPFGYVDNSDWYAAVMALPASGIPTTPPYPFATFNSTILVDPQQLSARLPVGATLTTTPTYASDPVKAAYQSAWLRPGFSPNPTFRARVSMLGMQRHAALSKNLATGAAPNIKGHGPMLAGELDPSQSKYNFIGYI